MPKVTDPEILRLLGTSQANINKAPVTNATPNDAQLATLRSEAVRMVDLARSLKSRSRDTWFGTGFGAKTMGRFSGTPAYDISSDAETLRAGGALKKIMQMSAENGGKNPLTPMANADVQLIANSIANTDIGQSDNQFIKNVGEYERAYANAYQAAGGKNIEADLKSFRKWQAKNQTQETKTRGAGSQADGEPAWLQDILKKHKVR